jgi:hypothetical protein
MRSISRPMGLPSDSQLRIPLAIGFYLCRNESAARPPSRICSFFAVRAFCSPEAGTGSGFISGGRGWDHALEPRRRH